MYDTTAMHCAYPDLMLQLIIFQLMMQHCQVASMLDLLQQENLNLLLNK